MKAQIPTFILRVSILSALVGGLIGVLISWNNGDELGWSLLRGAFLLLVFGGVTRWWMKAMAKAWLETRLEILQAQTKPTTDKNPPVRVG